MAAPAWREGVARALKRNRGNAAARYCQLATVRGDGRPACRTVVFRGFLGGPEDTAEDASRLTFVTDARSEKVGELGQQPACELCWYLPGTREQFRWARPGVDRHLATAAPPPAPAPPVAPPQIRFTATDRGHARAWGPCGQDYGADGGDWRARGGRGGSGAGPAAAGHVGAAVWEGPAAVPVAPPGTSPGLGRQPLLPSRA